jgi:hypothetical protein
VVTIAVHAPAVGDGNGGLRYQMIATTTGTSSRVETMRAARRMVMR